MALTLENAYLQLALNPTSSTFTVEARRPAGPGIQYAHLGVAYRPQRRGARTLHAWRPLTHSEPDAIPSIHGTLRQRTLQFLPNSHLHATITFAVPQDHPLLLWKITLQNKSSQPFSIHRIEMLRVGFASPREALPAPGREPASLGAYQLSPKPGEPAFFSNGWGSWNHTGAFSIFDRFRRTRLGPFTSPMRANPGTPQPGARGRFASDMFAVIGDREHRTGFLIGFLSQLHHFGSIEAILYPLAPALSLWANGDHTRLDPGHTMETDWACLHFLHLDTPDSLGPYIEAVAREHQSPINNQQSTIVGWCSWYHHFQNITPEVIDQNLRSATALDPALPLSLIQIDDGWQENVGDWLTFHPQWPGGPAPLTEAIKDAGKTPGLWLAPFILHPKSRLAADHPDWLLRDRFGLPANAGFIWNTFTRALDLTVPTALEHARQVIHTAVRDWGFPYLKLDFLYAAALPGSRRDPTRTRAQILRAGLQALRDAAGPEAFLLACGCPLGPAIGLFDAMRIGADVAPDWHPKHFGTSFFFKSEPDLPAARNAIQNALTRAPLHRRWWLNDPDCLLLRPESNLTLAEVQTLATVIALTGGFLILSDDLAALPPDRLKIAQSLFPLINQRPHILDWLDNSTPARLQLDLHNATGHWHLVALFNWEDQPADLTLNPNDFYLDAQTPYHARSFWDGQYRLLHPGQLAVFKRVPPHGCALLALRPASSLPTYLGGDLHISQGLEVTDWQVAPHELAFTLARPGDADGYVDLCLPGPPLSVEEGGVRKANNGVRQLSEGLYRLPLQFSQSAQIRLLY